MKPITVKDVMTTCVVSVGKDASFREMAAALREHRVSAFPAAKLMYTRKVRRLTVVDSGGRPESTDVGHDLVQRIRHVPGVVAIRDRLSYPPREVPDPAFDVLARVPAD